MLTQPGIDQQITDTMLRANSDPNKLQKSYKEDESFIAAIANEMLLKQREDAQRYTAMMLKQNPANVVDQHKSKLEELALNDVIGAVGPQAQKSAPHPNIPAQPGRTPMPQGGNSAVTQGIGALSTPSINKMAKGGLVAFAEGGTPKEQLTEKYKRGEISESKYRALLFDLEQQELLEKGNKIQADTQNQFQAMRSLLGGDGESEAGINDNGTSQQSLPGDAEYFAAMAKADEAHANLGKEFQNTYALLDRLAAPKQEPKQEATNDAAPGVEEKPVIPSHTRTLPSGRKVTERTPYTPIDFTNPNPGPLRDFLGIGDGNSTRTPRVPYRPIDFVKHNPGPLKEAIGNMEVPEGIASVAGDAGELVKSGIYNLGKGVDTAGRAVGKVAGAVADSDAKYLPGAVKEYANYVGGNLKDQFNESTGKVKEAHGRGGIPDALVETVKQIGSFKGSDPSGIRSGAFDLLPERGDMGAGQYAGHLVNKTGDFLNKGFKAGKPLLDAGMSEVGDFAKEVGWANDGNATATNDGNATITGEGGVRGELERQAGPRAPIKTGKGSVVTPEIEEAAKEAGVTPESMVAATEEVEKMVAPGRERILSLLEQRRKEYEATNDPKKLRMERIIQGLLGMGGHTTAAGAFGGYGRASSATGRRQEAARDKMLSEFINEEIQLAEVKIKEEYNRHFGNFNAGKLQELSMARLDKLRLGIEELRTLAAANPANSTKYSKLIAMEKDWSTGKFWHSKAAEDKKLIEIRAALAAWNKNLLSPSMQALEQRINELQNLDVPSPNLTGAPSGDGDFKVVNIRPG